ncbi:hypothetical protein DPMN_056102 [Dreissena polymorpha]|uniref:Uncharacterized protein n=1 Tax=Dreissena polymorpha TaxID=45954 RepID=A0A9D4HR74_DREPO|nr:hypothetical protein DPMN_056102 [Dreissena polymorpha]
MASLSVDEIISSMYESDSISMTEYSIPVQNRFKQRQTGGIGSSDGFKQCNENRKGKNSYIDDKLLCIFEKINSVEDKISQCRSDIVRANTNFKRIDDRVCALEQEIARARKELYQSHEAKVQIKYPARLYINGRAKTSRVYSNETVVESRENDEDSDEAGTDESKERQLCVEIDRKTRGLLNELQTPPTGWQKEKKPGQKCTLTDRQTDRRTHGQTKRRLYALPKINFGGA